MVPITSWAKSATIRTGIGARNTVAVACNGGQMSVFINGQKVGEGHDSRYTDGGGVGPLCTSEELSVAFRNLRMVPVAAIPGTSQVQPQAPKAKPKKDEKSLLENILDILKGK